MIILRFFSDLFCDIQTFSTLVVILGGDFNLMLDNNFEKLGDLSPHSNYKSSVVVNSHLRTMGLKYVFRVLHSVTKMYTRVKMNPFVTSRLDFILISNSLLHETCSIMILPSVCSDHKIVQIDFNLIQFLKNQAIGNSIIPCYMILTMLLSFAR